MSAQGGMSWWWLSFADGERPKGEQFLGVVIVGEADSIVGASILAHALGINPGGEVLGAPIPPEYLATIAESDRGRLLTKTEAEAFR
jgi:hypothetical protein